MNKEDPKNVDVMCKCGAVMVTSEIGFEGFECWNCGHEIILPSNQQK